MAMKNRIVDISVDGSTYEIDLEKLVGHRIVRVRGYVTNPFSDPLFQLTRIDFANGEYLDVEGEHDLPYLAGEVGNHKPEILEALYDDGEDD